MKPATTIIQVVSLVFVLLIIPVDCWSDSFNDYGTGLSGTYVENCPPGVSCTEIYGLPGEIPGHAKAVIADPMAPYLGVKGSAGNSQISSATADVWSTYIINGQVPAGQGVDVKANFTLSGSFTMAPLSGGIEAGGNSTLQYASPSVSATASIGSLLWGDGRQFGHTLEYMNTDSGVPAGFYSVVGFSGGHEITAPVTPDSIDSHHVARFNINEPIQYEFFVPAAFVKQPFTFEVLLYGHFDSNTTVNFLDTMAPGSTNGPLFSLPNGYTIKPFTPSSTPVPIPSTILLLGSGLAGLVTFRRKFRA